MRGALLPALAAMAGCAHAEPRFDPAARPTCLVLSVGGPDGVAHVGAVAAVKEARLPISCVVGTSMGALVGALYATAPGEDTAARLRRLARAYEDETRAEARRKGVVLGLLFGAVAWVASETKAAAPVLAAGAGYLLGALGTAPLDRERLVRVMRHFFDGALIERLPVAFMTLYQRPRGNGLELVAARAGDLAEAVGGSVANPLLFPDVEIASAERLDPGADRMAAVPIDDACRAFPGANLLVVNVTGRPAVASAAMRCPVREILVAPAGLPAEEAFRFGPAFDGAVRAGHAATARALAR
jgi:NTE family protein